MSWKKGDLAIYVGPVHKYNYTDVVILGSPTATGYLHVEFHDGTKDLIPVKHVLTYEEYFAFDSYEEGTGMREWLPPPVPTKCECGAAKIGTVHHLDFCPKYRS